MGKDRHGQDRRYEIARSRLTSELGWEGSVSFEEGLRKTVCWCNDNRPWCERVQSGEYRNWVERNHGDR
jgi:dTDP-glucose 4,6-dehydratase